MKYLIPLAVEVDMGEGVALEDPVKSLSLVRADLLEALNQPDLISVLERRGDADPMVRPYRIRLRWPLDVIPTIAESPAQGDPEKVD